MLNILVIDNLNGSVFNIGLVFLNSDGPVLDKLVIYDLSWSVLDVRLVRLNTDRSVLNILVVDDADGSVLDIRLVSFDANWSVLDVGLSADELRSSGNWEFMSNNWCSGNGVAMMNGSDRSLR